MPSFQIIFFVIALICWVPVIYWYYRSQKRKWFRPRFGEMVMVTLFAVMLSLGGSMLIGGLLDDPDQFRPSGGFSLMPAPVDGSASGSKEADDERDSSSRSRGGDSRGRGREAESGGSRR